MTRLLVKEPVVWVQLVYKLLALDQASKTSGWAYFEDNQLKDYGKFTAEQDDIGDRLHYIKRKVQELIDKYEVDELVFEDIQFQKTVNGQEVLNNVDTFKKLAEVYGVVYELAVGLKLPRTSVLASVWKSKLGIKGKNRTEQKRNAQKYVNDTYGIKATQDECDAICIGTYIVNSNIKIEEDHDWSE